jgi:signal transduction histidine kinase
MNEIDTKALSIGGHSKNLTEMSREELAKNLTSMSQEQLTDFIKSLNDGTEFLIKSNERLAKNVADLKRELEEKNKELKLKNRLAILGEFSTSIAHEIRNPLGAIELYANLIKRAAERGEKFQNGESLIDKILISVHKLNNFVEEMLIFANHAPTKILPTFLEDVINVAMSNAKPSLDEKSIRVTKIFSNCKRINIDPYKIERVFLNIILNAVQSMEGNGELTISLKEINNFIEVSFSDTGKGIPQDAIGKIFTPFFTTRSDGTGLGLSIAKKIIEAHNGTIVCGNNTSGGATFTVKLPC